MYHINVVLARSFYERRPPAPRPGREHIEQRQGHRGPLKREPPELSFNLVQSRSEPTQVVLFQGCVVAAQESVPDMFKSQPRPRIALVKPTSSEGRLIKG